MSFGNENIHIGHSRRKAGVPGNVQIRRIGVSLLLRGLEFQDF